jgi:hypothetical protein
MANSIRELEILKKYFLELNLKIQAPWRPGTLYLSTPDEYCIIITTNECSH